MKLVDKKLIIIKLDLLPRAKSKPNGIPSAIAQTTIFKVSQKPNKIIGA
tara:strand:- start:379 stop:525 length:147 start_codon:yes stop_codon:yes gene_type:complete